MKAHQRQIEASRAGGYGHYNFTIVYPSGITRVVTNVADSILFDAVKSLDSNVISTSHSVWKSISRYLNN